MLNRIVEAIYWTGIFLSPVFLFAIPAAVIYFSNVERLWLSLLLMVIGIVIGIYWAEKIRKKYGCANYMSRLISTPDFWPNEAAETDRKDASERNQTNKKLQRK